MYNASQKEGNDSENELNSTWYIEACKTGELLPGRPQVRPNIDFCPTSRLESSRACRKVYSKTKSHTPSIFTVICVCKHPRLLGVSVMTRTEGVNTALSVLLARSIKLPRVCCNDCCEQQCVYNR